MVAPEYKARLLEDGGNPLDEFANFHGTDLVVIDNGSEIHNVLVFTLYLCYSWSVLGLPTP